MSTSQPDMPALYFLEPLALDGEFILTSGSGGTCVKVALPIAERAIDHVGEDRTQPGVLGAGDQLPELVPEGGLVGLEDARRHMGIPALDDKQPLTEPE